ncbi:MAG: ABC transporter permease subunit [Clostridiaceae bacterium]
MTEGIYEIQRQAKKSGMLANFSRTVYKSRYLYILFIPVLIYYLIFHYWPIYGLIIAFKKFNPYQGMFGSPWVGFQNFSRFFDSVYFGRLIKNTVGINLYNLAVGFPAPIILALMLNEVRKNSVKRAIQTIVYLPHFLSVVVVAGMIIQFLSPSSGVVNTAIKALGLQPVHFLAEPALFKTIYVWSGIWQGAGWGSIVYLAALAGIDVQLYEAATVDGATSMQKLWHVTLPGIVPTIVIMFILRIGSMFTIGFEKIILLYNPVTYVTADVISTYVYRNGILSSDISFSTAVDLFNSIINFILLIVFNKISKRVTETSLW